MMTTTFFFLTPMIYLSGFIFPIENMPAVIQPFTYLIPLRYFLVILRSIFLKGVGLETLWPQALALTRVGRGDPRAGDRAFDASGLSLRRRLVLERVRSSRPSPTLNVTLSARTRRLSTPAVLVTVTSGRAMT